MKNNNQNINITREEYDELIAAVQGIMQELHHTKNSDEKKKVYLLDELNLQREKLRRAVITEQELDPNRIEIGDIVTTDMIYGPQDSEEYTFKLVITDGQTNLEIPEISINSPLGSSVYHKRIGEKVSYQVGKANIMTYIKSKVLTDKTNLNR